MVKIGRLQITILPELAKIKRKLPLTWVYQFPNGLNLYTYEDSDLVKISGRYYDVVQRELQFLAEYGIDKETVKKFDEAIVDLTNQGLNGQRPQGEVLADIKRILEEKKSLFKYNRSLHRNMWLNLFCFFYVLDGEDECHFSEAENKKKIELLEALPESEQDFFFSRLQERLNYYSDTLSVDIARYSLMMAEQATKIKGGDLADSLNMLTKMTHYTSKQADGQG